MTGPVDFVTADGVTLHGQWSEPVHAPPVAATVLCHPHPLRGGSMHNPPLLAVADRLLAARIAVLRFDFRGVGRSGGEWDDGHGERLDVAAAFACALERAAGAPCALGGWSFGAAVSLAALTDAPFPAQAWFGLAPAFRVTPDLDPATTGTCPKLIVCGTRDQVVDPEAVDAFAARMPTPPDRVRLAGCDHFFVGGHAAAAGDAVATFLTHTLTNDPGLPERAM